MGPSYHHPVEREAYALHDVFTPVFHAARSAWSVCSVGTRERSRNPAPPSADSYFAKEASPSISPLLVGQTSSRARSRQTGAKSQGFPYSAQPQSAFSYTRDGVALAPGARTTEVGVSSSICGGPATHFVGPGSADPPFSQRESSALGIVKSKVNCASSGIALDAQLFATSSNATESLLRKCVLARAAPGVLFYASTSSNCWPAIFSPWKRCVCKRGLCSSLSRSGRVGFISLDAPRGQPPSG